jgi:hypothetical protein
MGEISAELSQGKQILEERNKHILLAEKYGWDTVGGRKTYQTGYKRGQAVEK